MALPPRELNTSCPRCGVDLDRDQTHCGSCGADRQLELAIAGEVRPAIAQLRTLLFVLAALTLVGGVLIYSHVKGASVYGQHRAVTAAMPNFIAALLFGGLALAAPRAPLPVAVIAAGVFVCGVGYDLVTQPSAILVPGLPLALRIVLGAAIFSALRAALRARKLRHEAKERFAPARIHSEG